MLALGKYGELFGKTEIDKSKLIIARGEDVRHFLVMPENDRDHFWRRLKTRFPKRGRQKMVIMYETLYEIHYQDEGDDPDNQQFTAGVARYYNAMKDSEDPKIRKKVAKIPYIGEDEDALSVMAKLLQQNIFASAVKIIQDFGFYKYGIVAEELVSEFNLELVRLANQPLTNPIFTFYETLNQSYMSRTKDFTTREWGHETKNKQRRFERRTRSLDAMLEGGKAAQNEFQAATIANQTDPTAQQAELKVVFEQLLHGDILTDEEKSVFQFMLRNGGEPSNRAIGRELGIEHKKVKRIQTTIKSKIQSTFGELHELI
ncbi:hypothetical protein JMM81_20775 [Bacillus sp. V3B]|uniref:hypothetical protein n=1 Tax=Bacillus sp. V3B TaxID=2804915 RepID=UPI00210A5F7E|nr:hypothetical protein [Bacillus sp. V3B]MCQ6277311.1 hypothetical protein [Bacillus sp. V3B]